MNVYSPYFLLEISVFGTAHRAGWTNSMACSFPRFKSIRFYLWGYTKSSVYTTEGNDVYDFKERIHNG
jgi:hypothetical protein